MYLLIHVPAGNGVPRGAAGSPVQGAVLMQPATTSSPPSTSAPAEPVVPPFTQVRCLLTQPRLVVFFFTSVHRMRVESDLHRFRFRLCCACMCVG